MIQSIDTLLPYTISEDSQKAKQLKEISIDREDLVLEQTRLKNQVHTLLYRYIQYRISTTSSKTHLHSKHSGFGEMPNQNVIHFFSKP